MTVPDPRDPANDPASDFTPGSLRTLLEQTAPTRFDSGFEERVLARVSEQPRRTLSADERLAAVGRRWLPWLAAAAALLAMVDWQASVGKAGKPTAAVATLGRTASDEASETASETTTPDWSAYK